MLELLLEALALKDLERAGWLRAGIDRPESVAAHSWGTAWLALVLCPGHLDRERTLALAILHDLAEIRVGDITPYDDVTPAEKASREAAAARQLLGQRPDLLSLWEEAEACQTPEARFVKELDRLDMALQAHRYAEQRDADTAEFLHSAAATIESAELRALLFSLAATPGGAPR